MRELTDTEEVTRLDAAETESSVPSSSDSSPPIDVGASLDRYIVLEQIGQGGMGRVLRAYDPKLEREVALKLLRTDILLDGARTRLAREARAMARLSHPNVVAVYDALDTLSGVVLVMELVRGQTLRGWLLHRSPGWPSIVARLVEAGRGLAAAHEQGLLHRDFKPGNVLVPDEGPAKVTDSA